MDPTATIEKVRSRFRRSLAGNMLRWAKLDSGLKASDSSRVSSGLQHLENGGLGRPEECGERQKLMALSLGEHSRCLAAGF